MWFLINNLWFQLCVIKIAPPLNYCCVHGHAHKSRDLKIILGAGRLLNLYCTLHNMGRAALLQQTENSVRCTCIGLACTLLVCAAHNVFNFPQTATLPQPHNTLVTATEHFVAFVLARNLITNYEAQPDEFPFKFLFSAAGQPIHRCLRLCLPMRPFELTSHKRTEMN